MKVPFFDLRRQTAGIRGELCQALMDVVDSQQFILGPEVERVEQEIAGRLGVGHAVGVASGSDALMLSLMAANIGPGTEVIAPAFSFFSTASSALRLGARVVFADIDPDTLQIDAEEVRRKTTPRTRAVIAVHLFGDCPDMLRLQALAADNGVPIIEDAAQSFGAAYRGRPAGTMGFAGCFSFYPTKNLAAIGDAGMVVTDDADAARRLRLLRAHGVDGRYEHVALGVNSRLDSLQAAALRVRLKYIERWNAQRSAIAARYREALGGLVRVPPLLEATQPVYNQFVIRTGRRDELRQRLADEGVGTEVYYPIPLHLQKGLGPLGGAPGDCPHAEEAARTCLALPIFPELEDSEVDYVIETVRRFFS